MQMVNKFIPIRDHLDQITEPELEFSPNGPLARSRIRPRARPGARSGASPRASSLSEGHVEPEDDGPSKKVPHYDD